MIDSIGLKRAAVLCILRSERGLLLLQRNKEPHLGKYIPVGGGIEPFETPLAAARREIEEETGMSVERLQLRGIMTETSPTKFNWINYVYSADIDGITPPPCPEGTLEWIAKDRLHEIPTPTTDRFIYEYVSRSEFFVFDAVYDETVELVSLVDELAARRIFGA